MPGESHGQRGLVGCGLWGCKESDTTKQLTHTHTHTHTDKQMSDEVMDKNNFLGVSSERWFWHFLKDKLNGFDKYA